jgi:hypothetical protein
MAGSPALEGVDMGSLSRPLTRKSFILPARPLNRAAMAPVRAVNLPPSNGMREPGTVYATHTTAAGPVMVTSGPQGYYPGGTIPAYTQK